MLAYKACYKFLGDGVHAWVADFPGVVTCADDLPEARRLLASALQDMAELRIERGEALPVPRPLATDPEADLDEPLAVDLRVVPAAAVA